MSNRAIKNYCKYCSDAYKNCKVVGCPFKKPKKSNNPNDPLGWWITQRRWNAYIWEPKRPETKRLVSMTVRTAVKFFCLVRCAGMCRDLIRNCNNPDCPLYKIRPYQPKKTQKQPTQEGFKKDDMSE